MSTSAAPAAATISWEGDVRGSLSLIDQTKLPGELLRIPCDSVESVWEAIKRLRVRGAPAIGIAAAYGLVVGLRQHGALEGISEREFAERLQSLRDYLAGSRPTAVNLFWALDRIMARARELSAGGAPSAEILAGLLVEARAIHEEDRAMCRAIGRFGADLIPDGAGALTHCNAGGLATAEYGTALSVFFTCQDQGKSIHVFVDETRPLLQGARLTAWELVQRQIPATLICDSMAAQVMKERRVQAVITGADRIAANGDSANKIGTYGLAVLARQHGIPFYIAAPSSTFDLTLPDGSGIPIEERQSDEITEGFGRRTAPEGVNVYNPAFDVTPAELIDALITEKGVIRPVNEANIRSMLGA
ncbi:MAG TPA: S-methyl-5-thioribose-1-phosphate isomerase [Pirellulaceae bacterium]|jgi:methylthioribose-1-phosphate isomerase|nr:S-methyl-5-thioribose-1-phosphate isomerase [Pirellulaceae bacterium]